MPQPDAKDVFIRRLKQARKAVGLSQTALGRSIGLPDETASTRINRYERGVSEPDLRTAKQLADALGVSLSFLVCDDPKLAAVIDGFSRLNAKAQKALLSDLEAALAIEGNVAKGKALPKISDAKAATPAKRKTKGG